jgi:hypothetical protein
VVDLDKLDLPLPMPATDLLPTQFFGLPVFDVARYADWPASS